MSRPTIRFWMVAVPSKVWMASQVAGDLLMVCRQP
jgi:hypothetical protein